MMLLCCAGTAGSCGECTFCDMVGRIGGADGGVEYVKKRQQSGEVA
jgi:hypothetical protein